MLSLSGVLFVSETANEVGTNGVRIVPHCRRSDVGFRCGAREGPLSSLHRKMLSELRSMIWVHSIPSHDGK